MFTICIHVSKTWTPSWARLVQDFAYARSISIRLRFHPSFSSFVLITSLLLIYIGDLGLDYYTSGAPYHMYRQLLHKQAIIKDCDHLSIANAQGVLHICIWLLLHINHVIHYTLISLPFSQPSRTSFLGLNITKTPFKTFRQRNTASPMRSFFTLDPWPQTLDPWPLTTLHHPSPLTLDPRPLTLDPSPLTLDPWPLTPLYPPWPLTLDPWPMFQLGYTGQLLERYPS
jgi:hypothetical protein